MQPIPVVRYSGMSTSARVARTQDTAGFSELLSQHLVNGVPPGSAPLKQAASATPDVARTNTNAASNGAAQVTREATTVTDTASREAARTKEKSTSTPVRSTVRQGKVGVDGVAGVPEQTEAQTGVKPGISTAVVSSPIPEENPRPGWPVQSNWTNLLDNNGAAQAVGNLQPTMVSSQSSSTGTVKKSPSPASGMISAPLIGLPAGGVAANPMPNSGNENHASMGSPVALSGNSVMSSMNAGSQAEVVPMPLTPMWVPVPDEQTIGSPSGTNSVLQLDAAVNALTTKPSHVASTDMVNPLLSAALPSPSSSTPSLMVTTPVGANSAWGNDVAQQVTWMVGQQQSSAELQLNPPNLGPLTVVVQMAGNQANAFFSSPHAAVRDALQHALPHLSDMLAGSGLSLGQATVSDQRSGSGYARGGSSSRSWDNLSSRNAVTEVSSGMSTHHSVSVTTRVGLIDTFA